MIRAAALAAILLLGAAPARGQELPAPASGAEADAIPWREPEAQVVQRLDAAPWQLRWVTEDGLGLLAPDRNDREAMAAELGVEAEALGFEGEGSVLVRTPAGDWPLTARTSGTPAAIYKHLSAAGASEEEFALERTWFAYYEPSGVEVETGRELVVLLPGMFGTPEPVIDAMIGTLRRRGWHVLRMLTHPSRFTERASFVLRPGENSGPALEEAAREIAALLGPRTAQCAFAVEAVCEMLAADFPHAPVGRRIGVGMSGGGMALSTVMAREPEAYEAAVYIGAGCDFARIAIESNYADWIDAVRIAWAGEPADADRERFTRAYLDASPFDGHAVAPRLGAIPKLMLHGQLDRAVPAATGDLLWERLGEPERWSVKLGHETLFLVYLPSRMGDLLDWMEKAARTGEAGEPGR